MPTPYDQAIRPLGSMRRERLRELGSRHGLRCLSGCLSPRRLRQPSQVPSRLAPHGDDEPEHAWAELPTLPGEMATRAVLGEGVQAALQRAWGAQPGS